MPTKVDPSVATILRLSTDDNDNGSGKPDDQLNLKLDTTSYYGLAVP